MRRPGSRAAVLELTTATDAELARAVAAGDERAIAEVYTRHGAAIYGMAMRILRRADYAQEVLQEVILSLWERPQRYDAEYGRLRPWLLRVTHSKAIDRVRAETRRQSREQRSTADPAAAESDDDLAGVVWASVQAEQVRQALTTLNAGERQAIALAYFEGQTYRDVARNLELPEGTVKSRIRLGLDKLATSLAGAGFGPASDGLLP